MNNQLPAFSEFADDNVTEGQFKTAVNKLLLYLNEAIGSNGQNMNTLPASTGSGTKLTYTNASKQLVASTSTVGSTTNPVFMSSGSITRCSSTVGSATQPVYLNGGVFTACNSIAGTMKTDNGSCAVGSVVMAVLSKDATTKSGGVYQTTSISNGATIEGASLNPVRWYVEDNGFYAHSIARMSGVLSGTWRNISGSTLGYQKMGNAAASSWFAGLFQRIA